MTDSREPAAEGKPAVLVRGALEISPEIAEWERELLLPYVQTLLGSVLEEVPDDVEGEE